jgi:hypothetical protein
VFAFFILHMVYFCPSFLSLSIVLVLGDKNISISVSHCFSVVAAHICESGALLQPCALKLRALC